MIKPINKCLLIEAETEKSVWQSNEKKYAERGTIIAVAIDCPQDIFKVGDIVSFASHFAYRVEDEEKELWFIPYDKINGIYGKISE